MEPYTVALTSCGRFDLLERTLRSLLPRLDGPVAQILIIEDSGNCGILELVQQFGSGPCSINVLINKSPLGQIKSIDRLYSHVETEWVFHCEDDWECSGKDLIRKSFSVLNESDRFSMVSLRNISEHGQAVFGPKKITSTGVGYHVADGTIPWHGEAAGLNFNPGMRRMCDYQLVGPYAKWGMHPSEAQVSQAYRKFGYLITCLAEPAIRHIGDGRHVRDPFQLTGFNHRMVRSVRKRLLRLRGKLSTDKSGQ